MIHKEIYIGKKVYDTKCKVYGIIRDCIDLHNVYVEYEDNGDSGIYCLNVNCSEYDSNLKLVEEF